MIRTETAYEFPVEGTNVVIDCEVVHNASGYFLLLKKVEKKVLGDGVVMRTYNPMINRWHNLQEGTTRYSKKTMLVWKEKISGYLSSPELNVYRELVESFKRDTAND